MTAKKLVMGVFGVLGLAVVGAYALLTAALDLEDEVDLEVGDAFVERYYCPELIHGGLPDIED